MAFPAGPCPAPFAPRIKNQWNVGCAGVSVRIAPEVSPGRSGQRAMEPGKLSDYFAGEIFDKIEGGMQNFLLKTAYLLRMTPRVAETITGNSRAGQVLSDLNRGNYLTERRTAPELTYQYHALFREFLQRRAEQKYPPAVRRRLQLTAARLLEEAGQIEDAAERFIEACDWKGLTQLVLDHAQALAAQGRSRTIESWITRIPREFTEVKPWLLYWHGMTLLHYRPRDSAPLLRTGL